MSNLVLSDVLKEANNSGGVNYVSLTVHGFEITRNRPPKKNYIRVTDGKAWLECVKSDGVERTLIWESCNCH